MEYFINHNIISKNVELFHNGTRDDININIYKDNTTEALVLDKKKEQNYFDKGLGYWNSDNLIECRKKTYDDDIRRYNQLKNMNFNKLLDFGCGNGGLLKIIKDNNKNKNIIGIELNLNILKYMNNNENIIVYDNINKVNKESKIDIIMLNHVLEHLYDPIQVLKDIKKVMNKKTLLIIEVPHANDFLIHNYNCKEFKKFTFWSQHLILHTEKSLRRLLDLIGFSKIDIFYYQRYNIFNHLHWLSNGKPGGHKLTYFNDTELIKSYDNFLIKNKKTDTIICYCYL